MLKSTEKLVFVDVNKGISKNTGYAYCFVKLANPSTFENYTVNVQNENLNFDDLQKGDFVSCEFDMKEFNGRLSVSATNITKWVKNA